MGFEVQAGGSSHAPAPTVRQHVDDERLARSCQLPDGATAGAAAGIAAGGLGGNQNQGPRLSSFWNRLFGGPDQLPNDNIQNHVGPRHPNAGPFKQGGPVSNVVRNIPYLGDYVEALSNTHDNAGHEGIMSPLTAITNVAIPAPLMGIADAPFRLFGKSMFLDR